MPGIGITAPNRVSLGENSRILIGGLPGGREGVFIRYVTGTATVTAPPSDATDNMSGGKTEKTRQARSCIINFDFLWRTADNPFGKAPNLAPGFDTPRIIVWPDFLNDEAQCFKLPIGYCEGFSVVKQGAGDVRGSCTLHNQGNFYHPSEPDPRGTFG